MCRRQKLLSVELPYQFSATALDLLVDSTDIQFVSEGEYKRKKHGVDYRRQWRKVQLAIEVTASGTGDVLLLPELLSQIPADELLTSMGGDGPYDTKACHAAIARRNAQLIILHARTLGHGMAGRQERLHATKPYERASGWARGCWPRRSSIRLRSCTSV